MGLWQDIKDTYNYHKEERAQQKYFQEQMKTLHGIEHAAGVNPIQARLNALDYRDKIAQEAPQQRPAAPQRTNWLGRMAATLRFGSSQNGTEFDNARAMFSDGEDHIAERYRERDIADTQAKAHNRDIVRRFDTMKKDSQYKTDTYHDFCQIYGDLVNTTVGRMGPALMEAPEHGVASIALERRNQETFDLLKEYDGFLIATRGSDPIPNPERFQDVSRQLAERIRPVIEQGNQLDVSQYKADPTAYAWASPQTLSDIRNQHQSYMALSDWAKKPGNGPAATIAFGSVEQMHAYQLHSQDISKAYMGLRANALGDMANPTRQDTQNFVYSNDDRTSLQNGGASQLQKDLANAVNKVRTYEANVTAESRDHFRATAQTINPNRPERITPTQTAEPQKLNMDQLGERANMVTAPATQRPATTQQPHQPQKTSAGPKR